MAKKFPRFLFSDPTNTKQRGPFIIHTLEPRFICRPEFDTKRNLIDCRILEIFDKEYSFVEIDLILKEVPDWYKYSGIHQSNNADDRLLREILKCEFLKDFETHYTVDEARTIVKLLFPTKAKRIYEGSSSYGLKHLFEHVSQTIIADGLMTDKYCGNDVIIKAFELEGFKTIQEGPNRYMNILASEVNRAYRLFWNY